MKRLIFVALLIAVAGCVGPTSAIRDAENADAGLVYGYINGTLGVPNVTLYNKNSKVLAPWAPGNVPAHTYTSGLVVFDNVAPGDYVIHGFGVGQNAYNLGTRRIELTVKPGEIKYLGAFVYANEGGMFSNSFSFKPAKSPSHRQILDWAIEVTADTDWSPKLQARRGKS